MTDEIENENQNLDAVLYGEHLLFPDGSVSERTSYGITTTICKQTHGRNSQDCTDRKARRSSSCVDRAEKESGILSGEAGRSRSQTTRGSAGDEQEQSRRYGDFHD
jgi:hypothetical protein